MKRLLKTLAAPGIGILIVMSGFVYDVVFAGIPYQDPTPELQARYDFHSAVADSLYMTGGVVFLLGLIVVPFILTGHKKRGRGD
jgi:hypothetical protein